MNCPGTYHDSKTAHQSGIYDKLDEFYIRTGGKTVVDTAFSRRRPSLIKSSTANLQGVAYQRMCQVKAYRASAEWGNASFQG